MAQPTSHERRSGQTWDASYREGSPPWDIGRPQPAVVRLTSRRALAGPVLDAGCGTGENALHIAALGLPVLGVDVAPTALAAAREKARNRRLEAEFTTRDARELAPLGRRFATVLDCGLFHTFDREERARYVASLATVTAPGGMLYVLCFRDAGAEAGPHPVSEAELRAAFGPGSGWEVAAIEPEWIEARIRDHGAPAWLAAVQRIGAAGPAGLRGR
ncbi:MAG: class I SAM-dependent methyltransferase [Terriglobales bacterium]